MPNICFRCRHFNGTINHKCYAGVRYADVQPDPNPTFAIPCMTEFGITYMCDSFLLTSEDFKAWDAQAVEDYEALHQKKDWWDR